ncbi:thiamine pyrophosphate-dependent enzyme [Streptomyces sp. NPDC016309]|uniref:thiamine pyrophosphate-dependent enzyme n=1 Tax=Streptomyces sp. NPDC016309 TaxID=3364965 RepID=UPI0037022D0A
MLTRDDALARIARAAGAEDAAVFIGNGLNPRALYALEDRARNFYMMGSMGLALPLAIGFSRRSGIPALAVEGDGNALMGLSGTALAPAARGTLVHIVLDNEAYESTGGQRTPAPGFSFTTAARAAGYTTVVSVTDGDALSDALSGVIAGKRTGFIHVRTAVDSGPPPPRVPFHPAEITRRFTASLRTSDTVRNEVAL